MYHAFRKDEEMQHVHVALHHDRDVYGKPFLRVVTTTETSLP